MDGYYYKPRMDKEILRKYSSGIIALSGCLGGELSRAVANKDEEKAEKIIKEYLDIFGKENYFIEIQCHPHVEGDQYVRESLIKLAKKHKIQIVATQDSHYPCSEDHEAHHTLLQINTQSDAKEGSKFEFSDDDFSFLNTEKAMEIFKDTPEAITNTEKIAEMCNLKLELGSWVFPDFKIEKGMTYDE
jgi:DNA polymerase-3 subunit alpha